jgi:hypothetical protein
MAFTQLKHVPEQYFKTCHHHFLSHLPTFSNPHHCSRPVAGRVSITELDTPGNTNLEGPSLT